MDNSLDYFSGLQPTRRCFCSEVVARACVHLYLHVCKKWERRHCMCLCRPSVSPVGRSLDVSWGLMPCSPHIWAARLTRRPPEKKKKAPRGYEYKLSCWTSSDFTMAPPEPLAQTHKPKSEQRGRKSAMLCFGNTNVFGQLSQWTAPVIHKSERKERWIAGSKDSAEEKKKSGSRDARGRLNFWRMTHILQASWSADKISQNNEMITCNK